MQLSGGCARNVRLRLAADLLVEIFVWQYGRLPLTKTHEFCSYDFLLTLSDTPDIELSAVQAMGGAQFATRTSGQQLLYESAMNAIMAPMKVAALFVAALAYLMRITAGSAPCKKRMCAPYSSVTPVHYPLRDLRLNILPVHGHALLLLIDIWP